MTNQVAIEALVKRETDKALLVVTWNSRGDRREIWLPKSQISRQGDVIWLPMWLRDAKARENNGLTTLDPTVAMQMAAKAA